MSTDYESEQQGYVDELQPESRDVQMIQNALVILRFLKRPFKSGFMDEKTHKAIREFQRVNKLETTGLMDSVTRNLLITELAKEG